MDGLQILKDAKAVAEAAAVRFAECAEQAVAARGRFTVVLAGGSTPEPTYRRLAEEPLVSRVAWEAVEVFWGDERCVPPDHRASNYRMARGALLDDVPIPEGNVHRIRGELAPEAAAAAYRAVLDEAFGEDARFDLILLGMGNDGHTASLFPGSSALEIEDETVVAVRRAEQAISWRVTLTLPVLNAARAVAFLVSGVEKAPALARVRAGEALPAARVDPAAGEVWWLVDRAAGRELTT